jgi:hypothetical protein
MRDDFDIIADQSRLNAARVAALENLIKDLEAATQKRDARLYGVGENARRSARFARVHSRGYRGPAATVTQIKAKQ